MTVIDKPAGMTSHDVVNQLRRHFGEKRIGHAGTLDPGATGVLVVAVGNATRLMRFLSGADKSYIGEVVLGTSTTTLDNEGEVVDTADMGGVTVDDARRIVADHLVGDIEQVPPMVSALKVDGRRLHELAREGIEVERQARPVHIARFDVAATADPGVLAIEVDCSTGTYIRTLADDLGRLLGGAAHLRRLRRTRVGRFTLDQAQAIDDATLLPIETAVAHLDAVTVDAEMADHITHGRLLPVWPGTGPWAVFDQDRQLLAVYERFRGDQAKPVVVMTGA
ncbi:MAG: tRNA pseudouridine synthase [Ilumatobacteraceae bacterium]|nr:tRNA pseudouridine synthase [Ilumatobacteraceae bacterium]